MIITYYTWFGDSPLTDHNFNRTTFCYMQFYIALSNVQYDEL